MSYEKQNVYVPPPLLERGKAFVLSGDPKGKNIVYAQNKVIVVRSIENPLEGFTYSEHPAKTTVAKYAPSGFYIASADSHGRVRIWDTTQEEHALKYEYQPLSGAIKDLAWSEDSKRIVVGGEGRDKFAHAFLWDSGSSVGTLDGHSKLVNSIDFKQSRPYRVVTASEDKDTGFFTGPPFKFTSLNHEHTNFVNCVRYSPDGSKYVSAGADGKCFLYDGKEGTLMSEVGSAEEAHKAGIYAVSWSSDNKRFISASADKTVKMWDTESNTCLTTFTFPDAVDYQQLSCLWQGEHILSVSLNGDINFLDEANPSQPKRKYQGHSRFITALAADSATGKFYTGSYDGRIACYDFASGDCRVYENSLESEVTSLALMNGSLVATCLDDTVSVTPCDSAALTADKIKCDSQPRQAAVAGDKVVVACMNEVFILSGSSKSASQAISFEALCVAVSPDGNTFAVGGADSKVHIFDSSLNESKVLDCTGAVNCISFSPDGKYLATGDSGRNVYVFDANDGFSLLMKRWKFHSSKVNCLSWCPDSLHLASGSLDTNIIVWSIENERQRITIKSAHPMHSVTQIAWNGQTTVISTGQDCSVRTWTITHV